MGSNASLQDYLSQPQQTHFASFHFKKCLITSQLSSTAISAKYYTESNCWHGEKPVTRCSLFPKLKEVENFIVPKNIQKRVKHRNKTGRPALESSGGGRFKASLVHTMSGAGAESECSVLPYPLREI